ncbi:hypothetical protein FQZ97_590960 [compost metagenome]
MLLPIALDAARQGVQVARLFMEALDEAQRRLVAQAARVAGHGVHHRGSRGRRILRIERNGQNVFAALLAQPRDGLGDGRIAVAHAQLHHGLDPRRRQGGAHAVGLPLAVDHQRRALLHPDACVARLEFLGPHRQDQPVQDRLPQIARDFDHPGIGQEFAQVLAYVLLARRIRRAQVRQQHADLAGSARRRVFVEGVVLLGLGQVPFRPQVLEQAKKHKNSPSSARRMSL